MPVVRSLLGMPRQLVLLATTVAVLVGFLYTLSPVGVWCGVGVVGLFTWAGRGLPGRERRWLLSLLAIALGLRLLVVIGLFLLTDPDLRPAANFFFDGDGQALKARSLWLRNTWLDVPIGEMYFRLAFQDYGWSGYLYVLAYLQYLLGPAPFGIHLFNILLFLAASVALYRLVRTAYTPAAALVGLTLLLFLPTLFAWSISALKESFHLFVGTAALIAAVGIVRGRGRLQLLAVVGLVVAMAVLATIRGGAFEIMAVGLAGGMLVRVLTLKKWVVVATLVCLGAGLFAVSRIPDLQARVTDPVTTVLRTTAQTHLGHTFTRGHGYKLLDDSYYKRYFTDGSNIHLMRYPDLVEMLTPGELTRYVVRSAVAFLVVPLPWDAVSWSEIVLVPQQVAWYLMVPLALVGVVAGLRRDVLVTLLLVSCIVVAAVPIGLSNGNVGTLVRHRDTVVPFIVWLSGLGAVSLTGWLASRRRLSLGEVSVEREGLS
ncbi:MAG TPA: hypothetical protein QGH09_09240 [Vicinamibacterales bacterium]|jgi:hypothetical protein|nr:hypothetical protein [Vicinamibacterales bacterium]